MDSFIAWVGGKKYLRGEIIKRFPKDYKRYIEVFGGAGWVLFAKEQEGIEIINDIDSDLINLYRCIKFHCEEFKRELDWVLTSREEFLNSLAQLKSSGLTDIQRAVRYYYIIKTSFGSNRRSFCVSKRNLQGKIDYLKSIQERLNSVVIENNHFEKIIKSYDKPDSLFYLDPPYYDAEQFYQTKFDEQEHQLLKDKLSSIKGKFILSYNDCEFVRELYSEFNIEGIERFNNLTTKSNIEDKKYKELIIKNY